jgi:hypothetical protein
MQNNKSSHIEQRKNNYLNRDGYTGTDGYAYRYRFSMGLNSCTCTCTHGKTCEKATGYPYLVNFAGNP